MRVSRRRKLIKKKDLTPDNYVHFEVAFVGNNSIFFQKWSSLDWTGRNYFLWAKNILGSQIIVCGKSALHKWRVNEAVVYKKFIPCQTFPILVEVSCTAWFILSVTNEWYKPSTILLTENVTKAMACSMNIRPILTC